MSASENRIDVERRVVMAMYRALDKTEPRLPVSKEVVWQSQELLAYILDEEPISEYFGLWPLLFEGVRWTDRAKLNGPRCAA